jgi:hypothetical protein
MSYGFFAPLPPAGGGFVGWSPRTVFSGQTLNAGHFRQPATIAIGQTVICGPFAGTVPVDAV